ncbi:uncharacterized protein CTRU02_211531 [Colletotrichum truncatum]|uniref:Uncharacterized protein n=1 Tax=Colletotrichum truncatum TaxID=5467 RepID=A0ACC3YN14_COLTU|nr:uncharacterized protein CTRU02_13847 [Colletotrichum truncatum]KAF6782849.1 hypothetical protein CTRU02_13847 [Colletotrichum truncatum]
MSKTNHQTPGPIPEDRLILSHGHAFTNESQNLVDALPDKGYYAHGVLVDICQIFRNEITKHAGIHSQEREQAGYLVGWHDAFHSLRHLMCAHEDFLRSAPISGIPCQPAFPNWLSLHEATNQVIERGNLFMMKGKDGGPSHDTPGLSSQLRGGSVAAKEPIAGTSSVLDMTNGATKTPMNTPSTLNHNSPTNVPFNDGHPLLRDTAEGNLLNAFPVLREMDTSQILMLYEREARLSEHKMAAELAKTNLLRQIIFEDRFSEDVPSFFNSPGVSKGKNTKFYDFGTEINHSFFGEQQQNRAIRAVRRILRNWRLSDVPLEPVVPEEQQAPVEVSELDAGPPLARQMPGCREKPMGLPMREETLYRSTPTFGPVTRENALQVPSTLPTESSSGSRKNAIDATLAFSKLQRLSEYSLVGDPACESTLLAMQEEPDDIFMAGGRSCSETSDNEPGSPCAWPTSVSVVTKPRAGDGKWTRSSNNAASASMSSTPSVMYKRASHPGSKLGQVSDHPKEADPWNEQGRSGWGRVRRCISIDDLLTSDDKSIWCVAVGEKSSSQEAHRRERTAEPKIHEPGYASPRQASSDTLSGVNRFVDASKSLPSEPQPAELGTLSSQPGSDAELAERKDYLRRWVNGPASPKASVPASHRSNQMPSNTDSDSRNRHFSLLPESSANCETSSRVPRGDDLEYTAVPPPSPRPAYAASSHYWGQPSTASTIRIPPVSRVNSSSTKFSFDDDDGGGQAVPPPAAAYQPGDQAPRVSMNHRRTQVSMDSYGHNPYHNHAEAAPALSGPNGLARVTPSYTVPARKPLQKRQSDADKRSSAGDAYDFRGHKSSDSDW